MHEERNNKHENADAVPTGAIPAYLMDRQNVSRAKVSYGMHKCFLAKVIYWIAKMFLGNAI